MTNPNTIKILAVDGTAAWRGLLERELTGARLPNEVIYDAEEAQDKLLRYNYTTVISDEQDGRWHSLFRTAKATGATGMLLCGNFSTIADAKEIGIRGIYKGEHEPSETLQRIIGTILAEQPTAVYLKQPTLP